MPQASGGRLGVPARGPDFIPQIPFLPGTIPPPFSVAVRDRPAPGASQITCRGETL